MPLVKDIEKSLAEASFTSAFHFEAAINNVLELPAFVDGQTIVDLCSGGSNCVKRLSDQGARAYGVDFLYRKTYRQIEKTVRGSLARFIGKNRKAEETGEYDLDDSSRAELYVKQERAAIDEFLQDFQRNRKRYIGSLVSDLSSLEDNSVDLAFSIMGVSRFLVQDWEVLVEVINEVMKKLKKGGELQLYPWLGGDMGFWYSQGVRNMKRLEEAFSSLGIHTLNDFTGGNANRLTIIRPN